MFNATGDTEVVQIIKDNIYDHPNALATKFLTHFPIAELDPW